MKQFILFVILSLAVFGMASAEMNQHIALFASPAGTGDGLSADTPTDIQSAKLLARNHSLNDDVTIYLRGGTYDMVSAGPLVFTSSDSGRNGHRVTWRAYPGDSVPVLSGGVKITGWALHDITKNIWRAPVPPGYKARQFWVNGQRAERTKWFSGASIRMTRIQNSPYWVEALNNREFPVLSYPNDVELVRRGDTVAPYADYWRHLTWGVTAVSRIGDVTTFSIPTAIRTINEDYEYNDNLWLGSTFSWIENAYEFLDRTTKGHWFLPSSENFIYYVPRDGEDMASAECWLPHREVLVKSLAGLANVTFLGISFQHTGWLKPTTQKSFLEVQANNYLDSNSGYRHWNQFLDPVGPFPQAAVEIYGANNVNFEQCEFAHLGGTGLYLGLGYHDSIIAGNLFKDISSNALNIGSIVWLDADDGTSMFPAAKKTENILVQSNRIFDVANQYNGGVGIMLGFTRNVKVLHNDIHDVPYTGISIGWGWTWMTEDWYLNPLWGLGIRDYSGANEVAFNNLKNTMQILSDGGAIYSLGEQPGSTIHDNYITNCGKTFARWGLYPIYYDAGSRFGEAYNNLVSTNEANGPEKAILGNLDQSRGDLSVHHNYFATPVSLFGYISSDAQTGHGSWGYTAANNKITNDSSLWPVAAQNIASSAGLELSLHDQITENSAVIFGWKLPGEVVSIDPDHLFITSEYAEFDTGMWRATISGTYDNLDALVVRRESAPSITAIQLEEAILGEFFSFNFDATGTPKPTFNILDGPDGLSINSETGAIEWIPSLAGSFIVTVSATNAWGSDRKTFSILVKDLLCPDRDSDGFVDIKCGGSDCNDSDPGTHPGAEEICDGLDNNCNGSADDTLTFTTYYQDFDDDQFGNNLIRISTCNGPLVGFVGNNTDCNDNAASTNPAALDIACDGIDQDCSGEDSLDGICLDSGNTAFSPQLTLLLSEGAPVLEESLQKTFSSIQSAFDSPTTKTTKTIKVKAGEQSPETLYFDKDGIVKIEGGYDYSFINVVSNTSLYGSLTISRSSVIIKNLIIK